MVGPIIKMKFALLVFLVAILPFVSAHEGGDEPLDDLSLSFKTIPKPYVNSEAFLELHVDEEGLAVENLNITFTVDRHDIGVSDKTATVEREPGTYFAKYVFPKAGLWEVHVEFESDGKEIRKTFTFDVEESSNYFFGVDSRMLIIATVVVLLAFIWLTGLRGKQKHFRRSSIATIVVLALVGLGYSLSIYFSTGAASEGVVTCPDSSKPNECFWQAHWHAFIVPELCGEEQRLEVEKGALTGPHTHEEKNLIHWHDRIPIDKSTGALKDATPLSLGAFFDAIKIDFTSENFLGKKNGDLCSGKQGTFKLFHKKKGEQFKKFEGDPRELVWRDRSIVAIVFDEKTEQEALEELNRKSIEFPVLGTG